MYSRVGTRMPPSDWIGSMKNAANLPRRELLFERFDIGKRDRLSVGKHGPKIAAPERITHHGERPTGQSMKCPIVVKQASAAGVRASEFDRGFHAFTAGTAKEYFVQLGRQRDCKAERRARQPVRERGSVTWLGRYDRAPL